MGERDTRSDYEPWLEQAATVAATSAPLAAGALLHDGRFRIERTLGAGGMGIVYAAEDLHTQRQVALKSLVYRSSTDIYQLKREFRGLADLAHRNLVNLYELFADGEVWFFTMELVDGLDVFRYLRDAQPPTAQTTVRGRRSTPTVGDSSGSVCSQPPADGAIDYDRVRAVFGQLAEGVAALHAAGKLHRDLKPQNVMVTHQGRVQILDFGLTLDVPDQATELASFAGTPSYMAPEQVDGRPSGGACDWYAVGVMLYEVLCGQLPYQGRVTDILSQKRTQDPVPLSMRAPDAPADLRALCAELMARDPTLRPSAADVLSRLGVTRVEAGRSLQLPAGREGPKLVGRDAELKLLRQAFEDVRRGRTRAVFVHGHSGMGKTRVIEQFLSELASDDAVILSGRCYERESVPYKAFDAVIDALSRYLRQEPPEQVGALMPRDASMLGTLFPVLARIPAIAHSPKREPCDPQELRRRAFLALGELLGRIRDRRPLVLHLDDLQWSDADSTVLLMHLLRQPDAPRLLLVASHRSEEMEEHPCLSPLYRELPVDVRLDVRRMALGGLSDQAAAELLGQRLSETPAHLLREGAGNPFLLLELARHARSRVDAATGLSLRALVAARAAELTGEEKELIETVAVAAGPIALPIAAAAAKLSVGPRTSFEALRRARLARATGDGALVECFHDRVREALLAGLSEHRLSDLHRSLAAALSATSAPDPEQLAVHLRGAGEREQAGEEFLRAAERASQELGFDRAARLYALALEQGMFTAARTHELRVARARALAEAGRGQTAAAAYNEALATATPREALELRLQAAEQWLCIGQLDRGLERLAEAFAAFDIALPTSSDEVLASALASAALLRERDHRWSGRPDKSVDVALRIALLRRGSGALLRLDYLLGAELGLRAALLELEHGSERDAAIALSRLIGCYALLGANAKEVSAAIARAERAVRSIPEAVPTFLYFRGVARGLGTAEEDAEEALTDFDRATAGFAVVDSHDASFVRGMCLYLQWRSRACSGEFAGVARELPAHLDDAYNRGDLCVVPFWSGVISGLCGLALGDVEGVAHRLEKARAFWSPSQLTGQDIDLYDTEYRLHTYCGRQLAAWQCIEVWFVRFMASPMRYGVWAQIAWRLRGVAAVVRAKELSAGAEQTTLIREAERCAENIAAPTLRALVDAALACYRGDAGAAIHFVQIALTRPQWSTDRHALRHRLGLLMGGEEGSALVKEADSFFRAGGVVDIERFVETVMPGLTIRAQACPH